MKEERVYTPIPDWYRIALKQGTWAHVHIVLQKRAREQAAELSKKGQK